MNDLEDKFCDETIRAHQLERKLAAAVVWLELNQPDVFRRGLWDAINNAND